MIGVYIPTLWRPHKLQAVADNVHAATQTDHRIVFVCEAHDPESFAAAEATGETVLFNEYEPCYANALQTAYEHDDADLFIGANDDFEFLADWDTEALKAMRSEPWVRVVGLHDSNPACNFSTISLIDRRYIEEQSGVIDMPGRVNYPYQHNYVDTEFYCTAVHRGVFKAAPHSVIRHRHPDFGQGTYDKTYMKSRSSFGRDAAMFESRAHLWTT